MLEEMEEREGEREREREKGFPASRR
jgi:hypothetical protein